VAGLKIRLFVGVGLYLGALTHRINARVLAALVGGGMGATKVFSTPPSFTSLPRSKGDLFTSKPLQMPDV